MLTAFRDDSCGMLPTECAVPLPPGATLEVYTIAATQAPNTIPATDPGTGGPLILQTPPILTSFDVATVARCEAEIETVNGSRSDTGLSVTLTPAGSAKMAKATATAAGTQIAVVIYGNVVCAPTIRSPIRGSFQISGGDQRFTTAVDALTNQ